jgi:hypothetical protein
MTYGSAFDWTDTCQAVRMRNRGNILVLGGPMIIGSWFFYSFALSYFATDPGRFGIYWPRHQWLSVHIVGGAAALLLGPLQLWLGLNRRTAILHHLLGIGYALGVGISATSAFYLAFHTDFGWVFGMGFAVMAAAWVVSTTLATIAICYGMTAQHREWMIRSYVVTFAFVTFRVLDMAFDIARVGTIVERMTAASWLSWTVPLLITESIMQGRKIFEKPANAMQLLEASACSVEPEPAAFDLQSSGSSYSHRP